jgi:predicted dehydrogenase
VKKIKSYIRGSGSAGLAIAKSLSILNIVMPDLGIEAPRWVSRDEDLSKILKDAKDADASHVFFVANPHGLHAQSILKAEQAGFDMIFAEKPVCVNLDETAQLEKVKTPVFVFHGYRQMWGPRKIKSLVESGAFGELISIEGRYWQSSAASRALSAVDKRKPAGWKNEVSLGGSHDVLIDLATHWTDLATYLSPTKLVKAQSHLSFVNADIGHKDTHVLLQLEFEKNIRGSASISKTFHGAGNHIELIVLGEKMAAKWYFENPDEIEISKGDKRESLRRDTNDLGSRQSPFHGTGWLEGYTEIIHQGLLKLNQKEFQSPPTLPEALNILKVLLNS